MGNFFVIHLNKLIDDFSDLVRFSVRFYCFVGDEKGWKSSSSRKLHRHFFPWGLREVNFYLDNDKNGRFKF